jgi:hypothetical protein
MKAPICAFVLLLLAGCAFDFGEEPKKPAMVEPTPVAIKQPNRVFDPDPQQTVEPDPNLPGFKPDMSYLEKKWGIKLKSFRRGPIKNQGDFVMLLLEFTKDVEDLKGMRLALSPDKKEEAQKGVYTGKKGKIDPDEPEQPPLYFHYFDSENVQLAKMRPEKLFGELSGVKGDAFRLFIPLRFQNNRILPVRLEARPTKREKQEAPPK